MILPNPSRRDLLRLAAVMPAFALPALSARADLAAPEGGNPAHFRFRLGDADLTVISDGFFTRPVSGLGVNADPDAVADFLAAHRQSTEESYAHTNHLHIDTGDAKVLIDVGSGSRFLPSVGRLMQNMEAAGLDPFEVTHVVFTHAHPDHIWGVRDDFDEALIPDAAYYVGETEKAYWEQDGLVERVAPEMQQFVLGAVNSLAVEGADWTLLGDGQEVVPGVRVLASPGHTPGHLSVIVESAGQQLVAVGDAITHPYLGFERPDWVNGVDMDPEATVASRRRILDMAAADGMAVLGYHFPFPGVGHVMRAGDAYRFVPALWRFG